MLTYNIKRYILYNIKGNKHNIYILREEGMRMRYNKYDVIYGEFPDRDGSIQSGYRPGIVIQNNIGRTYNIFTIISNWQTQTYVLYLFLQKEKSLLLHRCWRTSTIGFFKHIHTNSLPELAWIWHTADMLCRIIITY